MSRRIDTLPDVTRTDVSLAVVTVRYTAPADGAENTDGTARESDREKIAAGAVAMREAGPWPSALRGWWLFASTDGEALLAYEQWAGEPDLDAALRTPVPYVPGIPGTEASAPVRYRLHRAHVTRKGVAGCVVTPVFDTDGPERQRRFVDEVFAMTQGLDPIPGAIAAHFHTSTDGTRVLNWAEWTDEQSHLDALAAPDPRQVRAKVSRQIPGVRPCGYRRWTLHTGVVAD